MPHDNRAEYTYTHENATWLFLVPYRRNPDGTFEITGRPRLEEVEVDVIGPGGIEMQRWLRYSQGTGLNIDAERQERGAERDCHDAMLEACEVDWELRRAADTERRARL